MRRIYSIIVVSILFCLSLQLNAQDKIRIGVLVNGDACNIEWKNALSDYQVIDIGVKNFLVSQQGWELDRRLLSQKPEYCIIYGGLPDILLQLSVKNISEAYKYLCNQLLQQNIKPIIVQTLPIRNHPAINSLIAQLNTELQSYTAQNDIFFCTHTNSQLTTNGELSSVYSDDGFMLNREGLNIFARNISSYVNDVVAFNNNTIIPSAVAHNLVSSAIDNIMSKAHKQADIVMLGNSITAGGGDWSSRLKTKTIIHNAGQGGYTTGQMLWHMDTTVVGMQPKMCFVMAGINDLFNNIPPDIIYRNQTLILEKLIANGIEPIVQLTLYTYNNPAMAIRIDEINNAIKDYCIGKKINIIDLNLLLSNEKSLKKEYMTDGTHLTDMAYQIWADELIHFIENKKAEK